MTRTMAVPKAPCVASLLWLLAAVVPAAGASPLFSIGEGGTMTWSDAQSAGRVRAVQANDGLTAVADQFYTQSVGADPDFTDFALMNSFLQPDLSVQDTAGEVHQSLVMSWDDAAASDTLPIAAWEYVYDVDPDLRKTVIEFSLFAPPGIWDVSLELIDVNGASRGWFLSMPPATWQVYQIRPDVTSAQSFQFFFDTPGFDIRQVVAIRLDEAGNAVTLSVPGSAPSTNTNWNAWNHLRVFHAPEPGSALLLVAGLLGATMARVRLRA